MGAAMVRPGASSLTAKREIGCTARRGVLPVARSGRECPCGNVNAGNLLYIGRKGMNRRAQQFGLRELLQMRTGTAVAGGR